MTKKQILKKTIRKAMKNGYVIYGDRNNRWKKIGSDVLKSPFTFIFSHSFAKAFFGERFKGCVCDIAGDNNCDCPKQYQKGWRYHLQKMVLEKDPIKYLEKFI